jgi:hypothetical protein
MSDAGSPRQDLIGGGGWAALGLAIAVASWRMDRLETQDVNPYTVPGLLPGLLGIAMMAIGGLLALRGWRAGGLAAEPAREVRPGERRQIVLVLALCLVFGTVLVGHGLPFWLAASVFVSVSIVVLQWGRLDARSVATAVAIGVSAGVVISYVFQTVFLVRLP